MEGGYELLHTCFARAVVEGEGDFADEGVSGSDTVGAAFVRERAPFYAYEYSER